MVDLDERLENLARQSEEAEALSSIYGDDFRNEGGVWSFRLPLRTTSSPDADGDLVMPPWILSHDGTPRPCECLTARCVPLETYPSRTGFVAEVGPVDVLPASFHADAVAELAQEAYFESPGEVCVFAFVEKIRQMIDAAQDATVVAENDDLEQVDEAAEVFDPDALAAELAAIKSATEECDVSTSDSTSTLEAVQSFANRIHHGEPIVERKSTFQAHLLLNLQSLEEAGEFLSYLKTYDSKINRASHNMLAYRVCVGEINHSDHDDDGEHGAGKVRVSH